MRNLRWSLLLSMSILAGCAGISRRCSSWWANNAGADWIVVQYTNSGEILKCWRLVDVSIANEQSSDGIYWKSSSGHLVHLSGWYNRVQVDNGDWTGASQELGVKLETCVR